MKRRRSSLVEFLRCQAETHNVPKKSAIAFGEMVWKGGYCPTCGTLVQREYLSSDPEEIRKKGYTIEYFEIPI